MQITWIKSIKSEFGKMKYPSKAEIKQSTLALLGFVVVSSIVLILLDYLISLTLFSF